MCEVGDCNECGDFYDIMRMSRYISAYQALNLASQCHHYYSCLALTIQIGQVPNQSRRRILFIQGDLYQIVHCRFLLQTCCLERMAVNSYSFYRIYSTTEFCPQKV